jgi:hypothetical protein
MAVIAEWMHKTTSKVGKKKKGGYRRAKSLKPPKGSSIDNLKLAWPLDIFITR